MNYSLISFIDDSNKFNSLDREKTLANWYDLAQQYKGIDNEIYQSIMTSMFHKIETIMKANNQSSIYVDELKKDYQNNLLLAGIDSSKKIQLFTHKEKIKIDNLDTFAYYNYYPNSFGVFYLPKKLIHKSIQSNPDSTNFKSMPTKLKEEMQNQNPDILGILIKNEKAKEKICLWSTDSWLEYLYYYAYDCNNYNAFKLFHSMFCERAKIEGEEKSQKINERWEQRQKTLMNPIVLKTKKTTTKLKNSPERIVQTNLQNREGGKTEVFTTAGRIDLLKSDELVEVKEVNMWKAAIGQVLAYSTEFPEHSKRIHLYGQSSSKLKALIENKCKTLGIKVTFDDEF